MDSTSFDRETAVYVATLAMEAEDYDEMVEQMKNVAMEVKELTVDERKLLKVGYGKYITHRRDSWGILSTLAKKEESGGTEANAARINTYKQKLETEITNICSEVLSIIDGKLIPSTTTLDASVFFYTMKGDYCRYRAEIKTGAGRQEDADLALQAYNSALVAAEAQFPRAHPSRLVLDLNLAVLYHSILGNTERALGIAKKAFDEAIREFRSLTDEARKESNSWLRLLNDNIIAWSLLANKEESTLD